jgi:hypothetical protein
MSDDNSTPDASRPRSYSGGYMAAARVAEEIVFVWLRQQKWILAARDARDDLESRANDIDFWIETDDKRSLSIEVKSDAHLDVSGRWLFELHRINLTASSEYWFVQGWSIRSQADVLAFYAPSSGKLHFIKTVEYRQAFLEAVAARDCQFGMVPTDQIKRTLNAYFPEQYVLTKPSHRSVSVAAISVIEGGQKLTAI